MGKTRYATCSKLIEDIKSQGLTEIGKLDLIRLIKRTAGSDSRTVDAYLKDLVEFGFLTPKTIFIVNDDSHDRVR